jgi:hypothetical protein
MCNFARTGTARVLGLADREHGARRHHAPEHLVLHAWRGTRALSKLAFCYGQPGPGSVSEELRRSFPSTARSRGAGTGTTTTDVLVTTPACRATCPRACVRPRHGSHEQRVRHAGVQLVDALR